ncbi:HAD-IIIC family phosphatase [Aquirufa nivalisilvae]
MEMKFSEIIAKNTLIKKDVESLQSLDIVVLANISLTQLPPIMEYCLRKEGINANIQVGNYDNILQDSVLIKPSEIPLIFWELSNVIESLPYTIEIENDEFFNFVLEKISSEIKLLINNLKETPLVFFNRFTHLPFSVFTLKEDKFQKLCAVLNNLLESILTKNIILVDIEKPLFQLGITNSVDWRGYYTTKTLYKTDFLQSYSDFIKPYFLAIRSKTKKVLVLDCDNTYWNGVVGEDGYNNVALSSKDKKGIYFREVHLISKKLNQQGVILCLCSKNNYEDVEEVFLRRVEELIIPFDNFIIKKINWSDKSKNINEIAKELNVGKDSIVFIDDSSFEIHLINETLPEVTTFQVPSNLYEYPILFNKLKEYFFSFSLTKEDIEKSKMYIQNKIREQEKKSYNNIEEYLKSLKIQLNITVNSIENIERVTQLINKTNQFNLTTKRYQFSEVESFYLSKEFDLIDLKVNDKFGVSGLTGVCIIKYYNGHAEIDTLLLSCRILGRRIENAFLNEIIRYLVKKNVKKIKATYRKSIKNSQVEFFYENNGFSLVENSENEKSYMFNHKSFFNSKSENIIEILWNRDSNK